MMGARVSWLLRPQRLRMLVLGPDAAGKTTLLYRLKTGRTINTIPTIGFNVEEIQVKRTIFTVWDVGGQDKIRAMWKHYFLGISTLAYVVDSTDRERMNEARDMLTSIVMDPLMDNCLVLIYANKQDMAGAMNGMEVAMRLGLSQMSLKNWHVQPACAVTGDGIYEGLDWAIREEKKLRKRLKKRQGSYSARSLAKGPSRLAFGNTVRSASI